jgi:PAS domain S-box-containing protein
VRFLLLFVSFFVLLSGQTPERSSDLEKITLQLQWKHQFEFAGFYIAKEKGFYAEAGIDVEFKEFEASMNIVDEVLTKRAHYGLSYSSLIVDYLQGKPIVLMANFFKHSPLVLVAHKEIQTPAQLRGKRIMGMLDSSHSHTPMLMFEKFGITEKDIINVPRTFSLDDFIERRVDAISVYTTNEIYELDKRGVEYTLFDPAAYGIKFYDLNLFTTQEELRKHPRRAESFRNASIRGWEYALAHKEEAADLIYRKYNTQNKSKAALLFEAKQIEYLILPDVYKIGSVDPLKVEAIRDGFLQSEKIAKHYRRTLDALFYLPPPQNYALTPREQAYLSRKKELRMCVDPNWMPLEKIENGKYVGVGAEMIRRIEQTLHIPIRLIPTSTWTETLEKAQKRECDIVALAQKTPSREKYLDFTTPFLQVPIVLAAGTRNRFVDSLEKIKTEKMAIIRGYSFKELLSERYEGISLVEADSAEEALDWVRQGKVFGFLDNALVINHELHKNDITDVTITGQFPDKLELSIGSRNDEPILNAILQKALDEIEPHDREEIKNRWSNISYKLEPDYTFTIQMVVFFVVVLGITLYWNLKLKKEIRRKESIKAQLSESETRFRTLFDIAPVMIDAFDAQGNVVLWNKECERVFGWSREELLRHEKPLALFYPEASDREKFAHSLHPDNDKVFQEWHPTTKNGDRIVTMWANVRMPNGEMFHIGYDVTRQREDDQLLREKTAQLKQAKKDLEELNDSLHEKVRIEVEQNAKHQAHLAQKNRLMQMGEMIENIAHQWRQPLAQINSSVLLIDALLLQKNLHDDAIETRLGEIESLTGHMSKTIDDFKNFFHPQKQAEEFYIDESLHRALRITQGSIEGAFISIEKSIPEAMSCYGYSRELEQVIISILGNAKDALLSNPPQQRRIRITLEEKNDLYSIVIEDNAGGVPEPYLEKIFEPYFTTKHKSQGTGLGLYIAKMLMQDALGGDLVVSNTPQGAAFEILIPKEKKNG